MVSSGDKVVVTVAMLTFRRPAEAAGALPLIAEQVRAINENSADVGAADTEFVVDVLVVDNDAEGSARSAVEQAAAAAWPVLVRYCIEPTPGISAARNRAVDESASSRILVFIDDDERPGEQWLAHLLRVWALDRPAAVAGRVVPEYEAPPDDFIEAGGFFRRRTLPTGTVIEAAAAGNLLLDLDQLRESGVRFSSKYGLTGGEDTLLTKMLVARGARLVWCDESYVIDKVPVARMTKQWVLQRAWSHGNSAGLIRLDLRGERSAVRERAAIAGGGAARAVAGLGKYLLGVATGSTVRKATGLRMAWRGGGMLSAARGKAFEEYRR